MVSAWVRGVRRLLAVMTAVVGLSGVAHAAPAMWEVSDGDSRIYLFGSMHVLSPDLRWRTPAFDRAYAQAGKLWFETRVDADPVAVKALVDRYGVDASRSLTEKLPPRTVASLRAALDQRGASLDRVDHLRPWAAAMMLSVLPMTEAGGSVASGADAAVTRQAVKAEKPILSFESFEQQLRLFADLPEAVEVQYLDDVAAEQVSPPRWGVDLQKAWLKGDVDRLGAILVEGMRRDRPELYEALLKRRNLAWAEVLDREMAGSGVELVTVGALHMAGPDGLPALMKARGYRVRRVQ
ncbi:TraB/GumN family protein [Caulobacter hibisci]|uniref:TraB/GumN family protein n=1 Tax=Caulobacter hibisci TaxID=2035993 RepID=A0ABS0T5C4_9CAUL|nr:TraB/GumN family protein [Caulobacter hibisci]MBI1687068.1 TraB/GumN family protein [Caulobacter hibisci]